MFTDLPFELPDFELINAQAKDRFEKAKKDVNLPGRFIGVSLGKWLKHVEASGVPFVPAKDIASISREVWLRAEECLNEDVTVWEQFEKDCMNEPDTGMIRIDPCSGLDLKSAMANGSGVPTSAERKTVSPSDPRAFDIVYSYPADHFPIWSRPWVEAQYHDGYPVEFRVFVKNGEVCAVANYYPQRALPDDAAMNKRANDCLDMAKTIVAYLDEQGQCPWMPDYEGKFEAGKVSATLDFLITPEGTPVFLEAGPPFGAGAHPCAFIDREVKGVALALAPGVKLR